MNLMNKIELKLCFLSCNSIQKPKFQIGMDRSVLFQYLFCMQDNTLPMCNPPIPITTPTPPLTTITSTVPPTCPFANSLGKKQHLCNYLCRHGSVIHSFVSTKLVASQLMLHAPQSFQQCAYGNSILVYSVILIREHLKKVVTSASINAKCM